jgi:hypothetical protein
MRRVRPLTPEEAKCSLANRFIGIADNLRQLNTTLGVRSMRVFVVWVQWTGERQGDGLERVVYEEELLPTPKVTGLDGVTWQPHGAGKLPEGSIRLDEVSLTYSREFLAGRSIPAPNGASPAPVVVQERTTEFFYELRDDGRDQEPCTDGPRRMRFRVLGEPMRRDSAVCWTLNIERMSEDRKPDGTADSWGETA